MQTKTTLAMLAGALLAATQMPDPARADIVFSANGTGSVAIVPDAVIATAMDETFQLSLATVAGPELDNVILTDKIDTTATSVETVLFDTNFVLTGPGGNEIVGTYYLTSDAFSDPVHEAFTGVFDVSGGTGAFAYAYGSGTFTGTNVWADPTESSGASRMSFDGTLQVPEPPALSLMGLALGGLALCRMRRREAAAVRIAG
nr:PEP-CTERM sorting domain-containing protein [uncultured Rhodopila sp.]